MEEETEVALRTHVNSLSERFGTKEFTPHLTILGDFEATEGSWGHTLSKRHELAVRINGSCSEN
jgi:hypothetical protein